MKNPEETIGKMIDKSGTSFVSYVDEDGYLSLIHISEPTRH